jgi:hypothetical protein
MKCSYGLIVIAATVLAGCNSADQVTPLTAVGTVKPDRPSTQMLRGTVTANATRETQSPFALELDDGTTVGLIGSEAMLLSSVIGAQVEVVGNTPTDLIDGIDLVEVQRFTVLSVDGDQVNDGILELIDGNYSLQLMGGGHRDLPDAPAALTDHVGERIWLTMGTDGADLRFGVIRS